MRARRNICLLIVLAAVVAAGCKADEKNPLKGATTTTAEATTSTIFGGIDATTSTTAAASSASGTTTTTAAGGSTATTATTTVTVEVVGVTTSEAPREATTMEADRNGTFEYGVANPKATVASSSKDKDPLTFTISCKPDPDGHGFCKVQLTNHVDRTARFDGGLRITVKMTREGGAPIEFVFEPDGINSLAPGVTATIDGSFDITEPGKYSYTAFTVVAWP